MAPAGAAGRRAVVSECVWFGAARPAAAAAHWAQAYPAMGAVADALARAEAAGWRLVAAERLSPAAWWESYYDPLATHIAAVEATADPALTAAIAEARAEMALFEATCDAWGYVYFALDAGP